LPEFFFDKDVDSYLEKFCKDIDVQIVLEHMERFLKYLAWKDSQAD